MIPPATVDIKSSAPIRDSTSTVQGMVCVGIATRGRPMVLAAVIDQIRHQTRRPIAIIVACTTWGDVGALAAAGDVTVLVERPGLTRQRNAILRHLPPTTDIIAFFDDDFMPRIDWLEAVVRAFEADPGISCITGTVLADGIKGPGLAIEQARRLLDKDDGSGRDAVENNFSPYGCNMAFRVSAITALRFDERLVLYGWLEDRDFGGALARRGGRQVRLGAARGVHLGDKSGRIAGHRLGYSQIVNPVYLHRKGTMSLAALADHLMRNITANLLRSFWPEPYVDRRGRLLGNLKGLIDLLRGQPRPERAEDL